MSSNTAVLEEEGAREREFSATDEASIQNAIAARKEAKASRDFAKADQIRDDLKALGIELIDKPGGITEWIRN